MAPKVISVIISMLGVQASVYAIFLNMNNWKADIVWALAALFWIFKLFRAIMRWRQEHQDKEIELRNKRNRYKNDIDR